MDDETASIVSTMKAHGFELCADDSRESTLTFRGPAEAAGRAIKVDDDTGRVWYGVVDPDGIALLTRSDMLPKKGV